jgi:hypothetical protein
LTIVWWPKMDFFLRISTRIRRVPLSSWTLLFGEKSIGEKGIDIGRVCFSLYENRLSENLNYSRICC